MLTVCGEAPRYFHRSNIIIKPRSMTAFTTPFQGNNRPSDPAQESRPAGGLGAGRSSAGLCPPGLTRGVSAPVTSSPSVTVVFASK